MSCSGAWFSKRGVMLMSGAVGALELIISNVYTFGVVECAHDPLLVALHGLNTVAVGEISNDISATAVIVCFTLLVPTFTVMFEACKYRTHSCDVPNPSCASNSVNHPSIGDAVRYGTLSGCKSTIKKNY